MLSGRFGGAVLRGEPAVLSGGLSPAMLPGGHDLLPAGSSGSGTCLLHKRRHVLPSLVETFMLPAGRNLLSSPVIWTAVLPGGDALLSARLLPGGPGLLPYRTRLSAGCTLLPAWAAMLHDRLAAPLLPTGASELLSGRLGLPLLPGREATLLPTQLGQRVLRSVESDLLPGWLGRSVLPQGTR
jgi:hypothetical protein